MTGPSSSARKASSPPSLTTNWTGGGGLLAGIVLTLGPYYYLATTGMDLTQMYGDDGVQAAGVTMDPILYVSLYPPHAAVIAGAILFATLAAGLYPALRAGRVEPVEVIRIV